MRNPRGLLVAAIVLLLLGAVVSSVPPALAATTVYVTEKGDKYHKATCRYVKDKKTTKMTAGEAKKKGLKPCKVCKPDSA